MCNRELHIEIIQPYCLKANQEEDREERTGNVTSDMINEGTDEGADEDRQCEFYLQLNTSSLQKRSGAAGLKR